MAYNEVLTNRVREALTEVANVEEKKMFRGIACMVNGKLCMSVGDEELPPDRTGRDVPGRPENI